MLIAYLIGTAPKLGLLYGPVISCPHCYHQLSLPADENTFIAHDS
jgi:hypothetical protein